jgi:hypothetical protein
MTGRRLHHEARDYFRTPIPEAFADKLAHRAEAVFARHPFWARKAAPCVGSRKASNFVEASMDRSLRDGSRQFQRQRQREFILMFMRHWLAGSLSSVAAYCEGWMLAKERPVLFRDLPESFKVGHPLPLQPLSQPKTIRRTSSLSRPARRFVHGCELPSSIFPLLTGNKPCH